MSQTYPEIYLKRVYDPAERGDGYRVLADRLWPRGIKKSDLHHDVWLREICPPSTLRKAWHNDRIDSRTFQTRYLEALAESDKARAALQDLLNHEVITLLTAAKNPQKGHLAVLRQVLIQQARGQKITLSSSICYLNPDDGSH